MDLWGDLVSLAAAVAEAAYSEHAVELAERTAAAAGQLTRQLNHELGARVAA